MPLPRDAQTQLEAMVVHFLGRTEAIIGNRFEIAVTPATGDCANWEGQGVNDLHLTGCLTTEGALSLETIEAKAAASFPRPFPRSD